MEEIVFNQVYKEYQDGGGLFDFSLSVPKGTVFGLLGPAGAGKSTAISLLMGFLRPDSGSCTIRGQDCFSNAAHIHRFAGFLPRNPALPPNMTGEAFIAMKAAISGSASPEKVRTLMERLDINPLVSCGRMNALEQQKLSILSVFMQTHEVLLLDEPAAHLDFTARAVLMDILNEEKARGKTVFMTSHVLEEVQRICDVIGIIRKGRLAVVQPSASLEYTRQKVYHITFETNAEAGAFAQEWEAAVEVIRNRVIVAIPASPQVLLKTLVRYRVKDLVGGRESLEESFLRYYGDDVV